MPLDSGSRGGVNFTWVPKVPAKAATGSATRPRPPIADSRSQISVLVTAPTPAISCHIPASRSPPRREGSITAHKNREYPSVIVSTGSAVAPTATCPCPTGTGAAGNHRSHCVAAPGWCTSRSAGSMPVYSGRITRMRSLRIVIEPLHPIRSAITVAGIRGVSPSSARTAGSSASTAEPRRARW